MRYLETFRGTPELDVVKKVALCFFKDNKKTDIAYLNLATDNNPDSFEILQGFNNEETLKAKKYIKVKSPTLDSCKSFFGFIPTIEVNKKSKKTTPRIYIRFGGPEQKSFYWYTQKETDDYEEGLVLSAQKPERSFSENLKDLALDNPRVPAMVDYTRMLYSSMYPICFTKSELAEGFLSTTLQISFKRDMQAFLEPSAKFLSIFLRSIFEMAKAGNSDAQTVVGYYLKAIAKREKIDDLSDGFAAAFVETLEDEFIQARIKACIKYKVVPKEGSSLKPAVFALDAEASEIYEMMLPTKQHYSDLKNVLGDCFAKTLELQSKALSPQLDKLWNVKKADKVLDELEETEDVLELSQRRSQDAQENLEKLKGEASTLRQNLKNAKQLIQKQQAGTTLGVLGLSTSTATVLFGLTSAALAGSTYHYYKKSKTQK